ncbi:MAG TPA: hypothetical protein VK776_08415 [Bryobacteraceae bacterium]|jgi:uncharacterized protein (TIGR03437 family)|nr:hypothetical protein [Bryobacteraceae bacterium]
MLETFGCYSVVTTTFARLCRVASIALVSSLAGGIAAAQPPRSLAIINAASGAAVVAPGSIASAFGRQVGGPTVSALSLPLPTTLGGMSIDITDSANAAGAGSLFYVSPNQINFVVPNATKTGTATVKILGGANSPESATVEVDTVAPGLFTANGAGVGVAAAIAIRRDIATQTDNPVPVYQCNANGCSSIGVDMGSDAMVFLELFGTGIKGRTSLANVTATIGGESVNVLFAGAQGQFPGLDQVNLSLPQTLHTRGETDVVLTVDGQVANRVRVNLKGN